MYASYSILNWLIKSFGKMHPMDVSKVKYKYFIIKKLSKLISIHGQMDRNWVQEKWVTKKTDFKLCKNGQQLWFNNSWKFETIGAGRRWRITRGHFSNTIHPQSTTYLVLSFYFVWLGIVWITDSTIQCLNPWNLIMILL